MDKVVRDGKVAVVYSPGFGAGWVTWDPGKLNPFHPQVIEMIERGEKSNITEEWCEQVLGLKEVYCGGAPDLEIRWLPQGTRFIIHEYDGSEGIKFADNISWEA